MRPLPPQRGDLDMSHCVDSCCTFANITSIGLLIDQVLADTLENRI